MDVRAPVFGSACSGKPNRRPNPIALRLAGAGSNFALQNGATAEAHVFAAETSAAIASVGTFLAKSTGKTPRDFGLFNAYFPEPLH
ncbi:MAG TPA: hypothetical protein VM144_11750 [Aestuariivirga sp.]|nr:hypothetical protein [Aestuariivirga sp.]